MNPQRTQCSTKAQIKKNKKDLEMKHKNRSSSNSLKDFSPKIWNGRGKRCVRESGRCGAPKLAVFYFSAQKPVEPVPKPAEPVFKKLYTTFWLKQHTSRKSEQYKTGWTGFHQTENRLSDWLSQYLNTSWTSIFQRAILAKIHLKRLYYILSLRINKGKMEVLDQGFWALVPTPTFLLDPPW
jgi:hypothetical protein